MLHDLLRRLVEFTSQIVTSTLLMIRQRHLGIKIRTALLVSLVSLLLKVG